MIDIKKAKEEFNNYIKNYNPEDPHVKIKISHIGRVTKIARETAEYLNLDEEDIDLAELIGLLHDIGRFEQVKRYHTFIDKNSINHGQLGVKILFEDNLIRKFIEDDKYDEIIRKAISNHNCLKIEDGLNKRELLHAKLIRDSDKTDIFYSLINDDIKAIYGSYDISNELISDEIYMEFIKDKRINYDNMRTGPDILLYHFAYIFDFNYDYGLQIFRKNKYVEKLYDRFHFNDEQTSEKYRNIYEITIKYMNDRLN